MYSNGDWHPKRNHVLHLAPDSNIQAILINDLSAQFGIVLAPGQENLIRVCDNNSPLPLRRPLRYRDIDAYPGNILVVHLLPKIVNFRIEHERNFHQHGYQLHVEISAHDSLLEIKHAIHEALQLGTANGTVQFQDRRRNNIEPTWSNFPHSPDPLVETMRPMRLVVVSGESLPSIPVPAATDYEATVQHNWKDVNADYCVQAYIRPGTNDADLPDTKNRTIEPGHVDYLDFNEFSSNVAVRLARLSNFTPGNRELARRLLWYIVKNRNEGHSREADIAEVLRDDLDVAITHMGNFNRRYGRDLDDEDRDAIIEAGKEAEDLLDVQGYYLDGDELEDLLRYQHIYAEKYHADRRQAQLEYDYP
ncbi:hypothetical protein EG327_009603 [Venturia inaequalis]|nr:hypothetical protein EG327_009603 [Venturia inaequalis]